MQKYTLTVLINEKVSESDRTAIFDALKKNFSTLIKEDFWGMRSLAYEIKHANKAFYGHFEFEAESEAVITLDKNIRLNEDIIRYLILRIEDKRIKVKKIKKSEVKEEVEIKDKMEVKEEVEIKPKKAKAKSN